MENWLETLIAHEVDYARMAADCDKKEYAWFLTAPTLPEFAEANRALRLRDDGRGPDSVATEVIGYLRSRGLPVIADVDALAEAQGIGRALRRRGVMPVFGDRVLMRYDGPEPLKGHYERPCEQFTIETIPNDTGRNEAAEWAETAVSDDIGAPDENLWRAVAGREAGYPLCRLFLARSNGVAAGACDLFVTRGWGRIDSVVTRPEFRRRGIATALVVHATRVSLTSGNSTTYLFTEAGGAAEQVYLKCGFRRWDINPLRRHTG